MSSGFVHLHVHSEYSLTDSTIRIDDLATACVAEDMPAVALTDQANLFALVKFYKACEGTGVKPIAGCDLWLGSGSERAPPHRVTVLCRNRAGYLNLSRLLSRAYVENRHGARVLVENDWFDDANEGLIVLLGQGSDVGAAVDAERDELAEVCAQGWQRRFGDRAYFEITRCGRANEDAFLTGALDLAARLGMPAVASNDVRFLARDDFEAHEARVCISSGRVLADPKRPRDYSPEQYLKSPTEMRALFADLPETLDNGIELAKRCNLELKFGKYFLPAFPLPAAHTIESFIRTSSREGLAARLASHAPADGFAADDYAKRLETELDVIVQMGFPGYFLIVADFINWAKANGVPVGPGRGSGAGSLVAYALGITDLDPLRYGLLFERFLNPERVSMPDFDVDFCMDGRDRVIDYVAAKYGRDKVSQIITYGTMAAKAVLRDTGRVLGLPFGQVDRIAKLLPKMPLDLSLDDALGRSDKARREPDRIVADFKALYESDDEVGEWIDLARKLEDLTRNAGKHAGGVVISPAPLSEFVPLFSEHGGEGLVTQFDKDDVETIGLVKFDFLGLRTLTIIDWTVKAINARRAARADCETGEAPLDLAKLPLDDPAVFELLKRARTVAIFQFESRGMQGMLKEAKPDRFEDIIALGALYRPGPMDLIPSYCRRKHGSEPIDYPDPRVEPVLRETYGIMVYQEQVMQMAQIVGGYSLGSADLLRRAMGKKNAADMAKHRAIFRDGAAANGVEQRKADAVFDTMEKFAGYGFNKSHAAAYALVSYQTAWLKAHYPAEFMAAVLSADLDNTDKVVGFLAEARALGVEVRRPDINRSRYLFEATDAKTIEYGLGALKGVGRGAVESIVEARLRDGAFADLADFCLRVDAQKLNKRVLEALIHSGAMDALATTRASVALQLPECVRMAEQRARDAVAGQNDMFGAGSAATVARVALPECAEWPIEQRLRAERDVLGHYLSGHPTDAWKSLLGAVATCANGAIDQHYRAPLGERRGRYADLPNFVLAGGVTAIRKQGDQRAFVTIEDATGRFEAVLYREAWVEFAPLLTRDAILVFEGGLSVDDFSGGYQMRVQSVTPIEDICERRARVLEVRLNGVGANFVADLQRALASHRGGATPVRLRIGNATAEAEIELGADWRVRASPALRQNVEAMPGVLGAELLYG